MLFLSPSHVGSDVGTNLIHVAGNVGTDVGSGGLH